MQPIMYAVGQKFPDEMYCNIPETNIAITTDGFFDLLMSLHEVSEIEFKAFAETLTIGLFVVDDIPFIIFNFNGIFSTDVSLNLSTAEIHDANKWLNSDGNMINLFLVDNDTDIILGIRTIAVNFADDLRAVLRQQLKNMDSIQERINVILDNYSTEYMMEHSIKTYTFR